MTQEVTEAERAGVARLTGKERECLSRWLGHATAKEIAIELGITHHAVEKRLKSARHKLGADTSLHAARIFAQVEGYGETVSGSADLSAATGDDPSPFPAPRQVVRGKRISIMVLMGMAVAGALVLSQSGSDTGTDALAAKLEQKLGDRASQANAAFATLDSDKSGFVEKSEFTAFPATGETISISRGSITPSDDAATIDLPETVTLSGESAERRARLFDLLDRNGDGQIDQGEFVTGSLEGYGSGGIIVMDD